VREERSTLSQRLMRALLVVELQEGLDLL